MRKRQLDIGSMLVLAHMFGGHLPSGRNIGIDPAWPIDNKKSGEPVPNAAIERRKAKRRALMESVTPVA